MATKDDLIEDILELDQNANTTDLTHADLTKLLGELRDDGELLPASVEEVKVAPYSIAQGKSVTSKKGILEHGDEIKAEYLGGGQKALDALVKAKVVVKA